MKKFPMNVQILRTINAFYRIHCMTITSSLLFYTSYVLWPVLYVTRKAIAKTDGKSLKARTFG